MLRQGCTRDYSLCSTSAMTTLSFPASSPGVTRSAESCSEGMSAHAFVRRAKSSSWIAWGASILLLASCGTISTSYAFSITTPPLRPRGGARGGNGVAAARSMHVGMQQRTHHHHQRQLSGKGTGSGGLVRTATSSLQGRRKRYRGDIIGAGPVSMMASSLESSLGDIFKAPDESILKAVEKAGNRAVPSDVAALAGIDLNVAKTGLVNLANLVGGDLEVSKDGDVVYNFPPNFRAVLLQKSAYRRAVEAVRGAWPVVFYGIRVSFGVVLFASIAIIFSTIFFAATYASSSSDDNRGSRRGELRGGSGFGAGAGGVDMYFGPNPFDFFFYRPYYGYYNTPVGTRGKPDEMGLLESVFSYIFGDGDPNAGMEQRRLEAAATVIRGNGGAVSAEQLAPLLSPGSPRADDSPVDESFMLPVMTALGGVPEVTEDGDIVYLFSSLQTSAAAAGGGSDARKEAKRLQGLNSLSTSDLRVSLDAAGIRSQGFFERSELVDAAMQAGIAKLSDGRIVLQQPRSVDTGSAVSRGGVGARTLIPEPLLEAERPFSVAAPWKKFAAGALGVVNLGGAVYLQLLLSGPAYSGILLPGYFGLVQAAMPFLLTYAVALNVIPAVRWVLNKRENASIEARNVARRRWALVGKNGGETVQRKLKAAKSMTQALKVIKAEDVDYTTAKSLAEQNINTDDDLLDEFDMRLKGNST